MSKMSETMNKGLETLFGKLQDFLTSRTIIGKEIQVGDMTLIPIIEITFGMGTGSRNGVDEKKPQNSSEGIGIGAKAKPSAVIVIKEGQIQLFSLSKPGVIDQLIEKFPEIMEKLPKIGDWKKKTEK